MLEATFEEVRVDEENIVPEVPALRGDKMVISPCTGRFIPLPAEVFTTEGEWAEVGTVLAEIDEGGQRVPVRSEFRGWVMRTLPLPGQPVSAGQALFWIRES